MSRSKSRSLRAVAVAAKALALALAACLAFVALSIAFFAAGRSADFAAQKTRLAQLKAAAPLKSASLATDLAFDDGASFGSLRYLATHNSYRKAADPLRLFYIGLVEPGWPAKLAYSHPSLYSQLDSGLRSFELDLRVRGGSFVLAHVPLVDDRSSVPDFGLALGEIALWSDRNPGHLPLVLLLELVQDYSFLDPALRPWDSPALDRLDATLRQGLGSRLYAPDELRGKQPSLERALADRGWPRLGSLRGRVLVVLHKNDQLRTYYIAGRPSLEGRAMFDCAPPGAPDEAVAVLNDPVADAPDIRAAVARRTLVRTRADADLVRSPALLAAALASGARIVSTDFPPGHPAPDGYVASLPGGRMLDLLPPRP
jgi:hypothetical protein